MFLGVNLLVVLAKSIAIKATAVNTGENLNLVRVAMVLTIGLATFRSMKSECLSLVDM